MIYKFDILFKKNLADDGVKVVTYRCLLEDPKMFGDNENLFGAIGELSLVREGIKKGFSLNSILQKYNSLLIGGQFAELFGKEFPLHFFFSCADDVVSIRAQITDKWGICYSSLVEARDYEGDEVLYHKNMDSFKIIIPVDGDIELSDETESGLKLAKGEVGFISASTRQVALKAEKVKTIQFTFDN